MESVTTAARKRRELSNDELKALLDRTEVEQTVDTVEAASLLRVRPQTMRRWACERTGPALDTHGNRLSPRRVFGRLRWAVADIKKVLSGATEAEAA